MVKHCDRCGYDYDVGSMASRNLCCGCATILEAKEAEGEYIGQHHKPKPQKKNTAKNRRVKRKAQKQARR